MALTKAEMAENLFESLGLSKRDAKDLVEAFSRKSERLWRMANRLSYLVSETSSFVIKTSDLGAIPRLERIFRLLPVG